MAAIPTNHDLAHDAVASSVRVVESAVELARAEAKLLVVRARSMLVEAVTLGVGVIVAVTFIELTLILVTLSPLFMAGNARAPLTPAPLFIALGISLLLALGGFAVAWLSWRRFRSGGQT